MSYYYRRKYNFSDHSLIRIKNRLNINHLSDLQVINYCLKLIALSHDVVETKTLTYVKVNHKELYFVIENNNKLVLTLAPIKPGKLLAILENN